jgi:hypothetical protein
MGIQLKGKKVSVVKGVLLGGLLLGGCSAMKPESAQMESSPSSVKMPASMPMASSELQNAKMAQKNLADTAATNASDLARSPIPQQKTQLIKKATLGLRVQDVEKAIQEVSQRVVVHGGDILGLQDTVPQIKSAPHSATFQLRVPQAQLDATLKDLSKLGTVESRSIQAEDVATQLVDFEARLKNLRKSEGVVLRIMDRSGSIGDVLKVSQQLSQIRNEIEQIQGQVQHLKQQVAYSVITVTLQEAITQNQPGVPFGDRIQESWMQSTHAMGETTIKLLRMGIWLAVFSPYILGSIVLSVLVGKILSRKLNTVETSARSSASD